MAAFIDYAKVERQMTAAFARVHAAHPQHNVTQYASFGGGEGVTRLKTLGFHARASENARLVCEAFYDRDGSVAVVRVFRERAPDTLFARKWAGDDTRFGLAVETAADAFAGALPSTPYPVEPENDVSWIPLSAEQRATLQRALSPIPPPFSFAATRDA